jgi:hypothetical protein
VRRHKRKLLAALAGLALAAVAAFAPGPQSRPDRITLENFRRIRNGMERAEVE